MEKKEIKFVYYRESLIQSVLSDTYLFLMLVSATYINYNYIGGNYFLNGVLLVLLLLWVLGRSNREEFYNKKDLLDFIDKTFDK